MSELVMDMWKTGPPPAKGQRQRYPSRFWHNFMRAYPGIIKRIHKDEVVLHEGIRLLHMFSGSMSWGVTTDIRPETGADIIAPYDRIPVPDESFDVVIADPPYNMGFANRWTTHAKHLPKPKRILVEASRMTKIDGLIAILHVIVIPQHQEANVKCIGRHGVLAGSSNAIRILNVFTKRGYSE